MTPLQKVAMGLVIIVLAAQFNGGWDGLPNPLGWVLVLFGVRALTGHVETGALHLLGGLALACSIVEYPPGWTNDLEPSAVWLLDLPQVGFLVLLCARLAEPLQGKAGSRFRLLMWALAAIGVLSAAAIGKDSADIANGVQAAYIVAQLVLIWMLFKVARRPETGGFPRPIRPMRTETDSSTGETLS